MRNVTKNSGFTLIELMITVAIVGIIAAVAYPAYTDQIRKSRRAEAQAALMNIAARQGQMLLDTRNYADLSALNVTLASSVQQAYTITVTVDTSTIPTFTASAEPIGQQVGDKCNTLSLNQSGTKTPNSPASCW